VKTLAEIFNPDARQAALVTLDVGRWRAMEVRDYHKLLDAVRVTDTAPEAVLEQFEVARNLMLYGWFVYEFYTVGGTQALASLEFGLREAYTVSANAGGADVGSKTRRGLTRYIRWAKESELLPDGLLRHRIESLIPSLRNQLAHGGRTLLDFGTAVFQLEVTADMLNMVYSKLEERKAAGCEERL
jgi:hypothetical protein